MISVLHEVDLVGIDQRLEIDHLAVAASRELAVDVEHVGHAAAHAGGEVAPGPAEHDHAAAGHVLAAVVADALDDHVAPLLRTQNRSPATPRTNASPLVAP